jgi:hypothetical protein
MDSINKTDFSESISDKELQDFSAELSVDEETSAEKIRIPNLQLQFQLQLLLFRIILHFQMKN